MKGDENGGGAPEMTHEEQLQAELDARALFFTHMNMLKDAQGLVETARTNLKNTKNTIKEEGGRIGRLELAIRADRDDGAEELREQLEDVMKVMRWLGIAPEESQVEMFTVEQLTDDVRVAESGLRAGLQGKTCDNPYPPGSPHYNIWLAKWQEGQAALVRSKMRPIEPTPIEEAIDAAPPAPDDEPPVPEPSAPLPHDEWAKANRAMIAEGDAQILARSKQAGVGTAAPTFRIVT